MSLCWKISQVVGLNPTWTGSGLSCSADTLCHALGGGSERLPIMSTVKSHMNNMKNIDLLLANDCN